MKKIYSYLSLLIFIASCSQADKSIEFKSGIWRGALNIDTVNNETVVPFNFMVAQTGKDTFTVEFMNAGERIKATEVTVTNDSVFIRMPVFDSEFKAKISGDSLTGFWYNFARKNYKLPFIAHYNIRERFIINQSGERNISGRWSTRFSPGTADSMYAIGEFLQNGDALTGTFLTESGDFRYLEGAVSGNQLSMSAFDGTHVWLFTADIINDSTMDGLFYSGKHSKQSWKAEKNENATLRCADSIAYVKKNGGQFTFNLVDLEGNPVNQSDARFKNKSLIIQIMGTWCPNCLDESKLFAEFYTLYHDKGLEIIAADFERTDDLGKVKSNIRRITEYTQADYPFLFGGQANSERLSEVFPELENFSGYPTSIFIDKKGTVRKIHTGFSGPGTGEHYTDLKKEMQSFIELLLNE